MKEARVGRKSGASITHTKLTFGQPGEKQKREAVMEQGEQGEQGEQPTDKDGAVVEGREVGMGSATSSGNRLQPSKLQWWKRMGRTKMEM